MHHVSNPPEHYGRPPQQHQQHQQPQPSQWSLQQHQPYHASQYRSFAPPRNTDVMSNGGPHTMVPIHQYYSPQSSYSNHYPQQPIRHPSPAHYPPPETNTRPNQFYTANRTSTAPHMPPPANSGQFQPGGSALYASQPASASPPIEMQRQRASSQSGRTNGPIPPNTSQRREVQNVGGRSNVRQPPNAQPPITEPIVDEKTKLRAEMTALLGKMRELNEKDADMLFEVWNEERARKVPEIAEKSQHPPSLNPPTTPVPATSKLLLSPETNQQPQSTPKGSDISAKSKMSLAQATCRILMSNPRNEGKVVGTSEIISLLEAQGNYKTLCETLEKKGFILDRHVLAKALIAEVPEIVKPPSTAAQSSNKSAQIAGIMEPSAATQATYPNMAVSVATQASISTTSPPNSGNSSTSDGQIAPRSSLTPVNPVNQHLEPGDKQNTSLQNAESQVSTTTASVDDRAGKAPPPERSGQFNAPMDSSLEGLDAVKNFVNSRWQQSPSSIKNVNNSKATCPGPTTPNQTIQSKESLSRKRNFSDLIDLTVTSDGEEDNTSNVTLNHHFPPTKRQELQNVAVGLQQLSNNSALVAPELSNPVGPVGSNTAVTSADASRLAGSGAPRQNEMETTPQTKISTLPSDHSYEGSSLICQIDKSKAIRRSKYDPLTIARDVLLATGRHPEMRSLNGHLEILLQAFKLGGQPDLSTFRWDLVDPGGPPPGSGAPDSQKPGAVEVDIDDDDPNVGTAQQPNATPKPTAVEHGTSDALKASGLYVWKPYDPKTVPTGEPEVASGGSSKMTPVSKRRGRPPRGEGLQQRPGPQTPGQGSTSYAELQAQSATDGQPRKRGRPVGWRKWMAKGQGDSSRSSPSLSTAKPGPKPIYQLYVCKWRNCGAELHNLSKLSTHVRKLHVKPNEQTQYPCLWDECPMKTHRDPDTGETAIRDEPNAYVSAANLISHIEKKHIAQIAWQLGDGPRDGVAPQEVDSELSEAYLSDSHGRQVTPVILPSPSSRSVTAERGGNITRQTPEEKALAEQRRAEQKRRQLGPGIDKGGARLVNDKRRQGLMEVDSIEVVDLDD